MALRKILTLPDPLLRKAAAPITEITKEVRTLLNDLAETMYDAPGIGLAATQVGAMVRAIVIDLGEREDESQPEGLFKLINPEIIDREGFSESEEGCLSIPDVRETVRRSARVVVRALDENGKTVELEGTGLFSACLQHEIDHLDGVLFIDRLTPVRRELVKAKIRKMAEGARKES